MTNAISAHGLTKRYNELVAVDAVSFEVPAASTFAYLGTNGAGKSTTISCLTAVLPFESGTAQVAGYDVEADSQNVREHIGVVFQDSLLDPLLSVQENLQFRAQLHGIEKSLCAKRIDELAQILNFDDFRKQRYGTLSGGQRRRVDIARALLHQPSILFLDEPTTGLDPASRNDVWQALNELRSASGLTVFLTTHYMEETEEADTVCILNAGKIAAMGSPQELRARYSRSYLTLVGPDRNAITSEAERLGFGVPELVADGDAIRVAVENSSQARALLEACGASVRDFEFRHGRMDDVFLALTGENSGIEVSK